MSKLIVSSARDDQAEEIVTLWRQSFQRAMDLPEQNDPAEFEHQLAFYHTISLDHISIARLGASNPIAGFLVRKGEIVEHLYVAVNQQGMGIGSCLLDYAKAANPIGLRLHTFQRNVGAQQFYRSQGFVEVSRGVASLEDNPWASSKAQLRDIEYQWTANARE